MERDGPAGPHRGGHRDRPRGLHADDPRGGAALAQPGTAAAEQSAAADGQHHRAQLATLLLAQLLRGLEGDRALTGHDQRMVEGRDLHGAGAVGVVRRRLRGVVEGVADEHELDEVSSDRRDPLPLLPRRGAGHVDPAGHAQGAAGPRHALGMVARAGRDHAGLALNGVEGVQEQVGAAQLVGAHRLEVLALEPDRHPGQGAQPLAALERGASDCAAEPGRGLFDLRSADREGGLLGPGGLGAHTCSSMGFVPRERAHRPPSGSMRSSSRSMSS